MKKIRWEQPRRTIPKHPYRDSAILYGILAGVVVGISAATGGNVRKAVTIAGILWVVATAYAWWRWHERIHAGEKDR